MDKISLYEIARKGAKNKINNDQHSVDILKLHHGITLSLTVKVFETNLWDETHKRGY